jgi:hypothetical protein
VDILLSDIIESEETLDTSKLAREPPPPAFQQDVTLGIVI